MKSALIWLLIGSFCLRAGALSTAGLSNWALHTQRKSLGEYFQGAGARQAPRSEERQVLKNDLLKLVSEYRGSHLASADRRFIEDTLWPFVDRLTSAQLRHIAGAGRRPLSAWTLDEVIAAQLWQFWTTHDEAQSEYQGLSWSGWAKLLALGVAVTGFIGTTTWMLLITSPLTSMANAATDPVMRPIIEKIRQLGLAKLGRMSVPLNNWFNRKGISESGVDGANRITAGNRVVHYTNFGGMTVNDQRANLIRLQNIWTELELRYGQIFTQSMRIGRTHLEYILTSELDAAQMVQNLNAASEVHQVLSEQILNRVLTRGGLDSEYVESIQNLFDTYQTNFTIESLDELTLQGRESLVARLTSAERGLRVVGFTTRDLRQLRRSGFIRQNLRVVKATVLAIQNLIDFGRPEGNRGSVEAVTRLWSSVRRHSGLQDETDSVANLVRDIERNLGMRVQGNFDGTKGGDIDAMYDCLQSFIEQYRPSQPVACEGGLFNVDEIKPSEEEHDAIETTARAMLTDPFDEFYGRLAMINDLNRREQLAMTLAQRLVHTGFTRVELIKVLMNGMRLCAGAQTAANF